MTRVVKLTLFQLRFQFRQGIHPLYLGISALYMVILLLIPESARIPVASLLMLSEPAILGLMFVGGILFFERKQGTLNMLYITPVRIGEYLAALLLSLAVIALFLVAVICRTTAPFGPRHLMLIPSAVLTSTLFTSLGVILSRFIKDIIVYLVVSGLLLTPVILPLLDHFGLITSDLFFFIPTQGTLSLFRYALQGTEPLYRVILSFVTLGIGNALMIFGAFKALKGEVK